MEGPPKRFCSPSELGNPQKDTGFHIPTATATQAVKSNKLLNPRKSHDFPDSCAEPKKRTQFRTYFELGRWREFTAVGCENYSNALDCQLSIEAYNGRLKFFRANWLSTARTPTRMTEVCVRRLGSENSPSRAHNAMSNNVPPAKGKRHRPLLRVPGAGWRCQSNLCSL
jgi:hypothetical protein